MYKPDLKLLRSSLLTYRNDKSFTGCSLGVIDMEGGGHAKQALFVGKEGVEKSDSDVDERSFFDLASLTKPLVTVLALLSLLKEKKISLDDTLQSLLNGENVPGDKKNIRLLHLLRHTSGLPSHKPYYKQIRKLGSRERRHAFLQSILHEKLLDRPGKTYRYSDLDYMLLGMIIENISNRDLASYWKKKITDPLLITNKFYCYGAADNALLSGFVQTGRCPWSGDVLKGIVHDDNCRALGNLAGHAGLFATLGGVMELCENIMLMIEGKTDHPSISRGDLELLVQKRNEENWAIGFDVKSGNCPSSGRYFSDYTIGHLGYTGTSFWLDLRKRVGVVLLTNRVIYGDEPGKIKKIRPDVHDDVMAILKKI